MIFKKLWFIQLIKRISKQENQTIDQIAFFLIHLKIHQQLIQPIVYLFHISFIPSYIPLVLILCPLELFKHI